MKLPWVSRRVSDAAYVGLKREMERRLSDVRADARHEKERLGADIAALKSRLAAAGRKDADLRASYLNTIADARGRSGLLRWLNAAWEENEIPAELRRVYLPARAAWAIASEAHRQRAESLKVNSPPYSQRHAFKAAQTATIPAADAIGLFELDGVRFFAVVVPDAAPISP